MLFGQQKFKYTQQWEKDLFLQREYSLEEWLNKKDEEDLGCDSPLNWEGEGY